MSKQFLACVSDGGTVRTVSLPDNKYMKTCTISGQTYDGEVQTKLTKKEKKRNAFRKKNRI